MRLPHAPPHGKPAPLLADKARSIAVLKCILTHFDFVLGVKVYDSCDRICLLRHSIRHFDVALNYGKKNELDKCSVRKRQQ